MTQGHDNDSRRKRRPSNRRPYLQRFLLSLPENLTNPASRCIVVLVMSRSLRAPQRLITNLYHTVAPRAAVMNSMWLRLLNVPRHRKRGTVGACCTLSQVQCVTTHRVSEIPGKCGNRKNDPGATHERSPCGELRGKRPDQGPNYVHNHALSK